MIVLSSPRVESEQPRVSRWWQAPIPVLGKRSRSNSPSSQCHRTQQRARHTTTHEQHDRQPGIENEQRDDDVTSAFDDSYNNRQPTVDRQDRNEHCNRSMNHPFPLDQLDHLIDMASHHYNQSRSWNEFVQTIHGERSNFHDQVNRLPHPAASILQQLSKEGAPVKLSTEPWSQSQRQEAIRRGPHEIVQRPPRL